MSWTKAISIGIVMVLLLGLLPAASMADGTTIMVQPGSDSIAVGGTTTVSIRIEGVTELYGAEVHMTFSPGIVQVVDADGNAGNGVQVAAGDIFAGKNAFNALNAVNNSTGTININSANFFGADAPFGGYKQSGVGREMGVEGFEEYLQIKTIGVEA